TLPGRESGTLSLAISPDGRLLADGSRDGTVTIWELPTARNLATLHAHQGSVWGVDFSPDGRLLATAGEDKLGRLWDLGKLPDARAFACFFCGQRAAPKRFAPRAPVRAVRAVRIATRPANIPPDLATPNPTGHEGTPCVAGQCW